MVNFYTILSVIWLIIGIACIGFGIYGAFFQDLPIHKNVDQNWLDKNFPLLLWGGLGLYFLWGAKKRYIDGMEERGQAESLLSNNTSEKKKEYAAPPMPDDYPDKVKTILGNLAKYDIKPYPYSDSQDEQVKNEEEFVSYLWLDKVSESLQKSGYKRALNQNEILETTAYDVLFCMREEGEEGQSFSKDIMRLYWDVEEDPGYYRDYAIELRDLAKGSFPLENIEDVALDDDIRYQRELRFQCCGEKYIWPFEVDGKGLNYDLLCKLGELYRQKSKGYRFAVFADGEVVRLKDDQLESFSELIGFEAEWMDESGN